MTVEQSQPIECSNFHSSTYKFQEPEWLQELNEIELQEMVMQNFEAPLCLKEIPLLLIPPYLLNFPDELKPSHPLIQAKLQTWLNRARQEDELYRVERRFIPHVPIYLPDNPKGRQFFRIAQAIASIPNELNAIPKNESQGYWLRTIRQFWQARGVILAYKLTGIIPNPIGKGGVLYPHLSERTAEEIHLLTEIDLALFKLLVRGQRIIKRWSLHHYKQYPFQQPLDLFLAILSESLQYYWESRPMNIGSTWETRQDQRAEIKDQISVLEEMIWVEQPFGKSDRLKRKCQDYVDYLQQSGWSGRWILALRSHPSVPYHPHFDTAIYEWVKAIQHGQDLFVDLINWRGGQPYQKVSTNNPKLLKKYQALLGNLLWSKS